MFCPKNQWFITSVSRRITSDIIRRHKSKNAKTISPCTRALNHFDDFYKVIFKNKWPSVRLALLSKEKTVAVINNFGDAEGTEKLLQSKGAFDLKQFLENEKENVKDLPKTKTLKTGDRPGELEKIISKQQKEKEQTEFELSNPRGKEGISKARFHNEEDHAKDKDERSDKEECLEDLETSKTSLHSDISRAEIDHNRLILADSQRNEALYEFVPSTQLRGLQNYIPESEYYKYYQVKKETPVVIEPEYDLEFPEHLKVYIFDRGDISSFPDPTRCVNDVYNFLEVDGAALLTALAFGVQPGDTVYDMLSTSGNTAYCIFQSLRPNLLVCKKTQNVEDIFSQYLFDYSPSWKQMLLITNHYFDESCDENSFDKILVDVPCTNDRFSLFEPEDNIFHLNNLQKRFKLPEFQTRCLAKALRLVRPGGTVIYSTTTMSPVQNDGVVHEALKVVWNESKTEFTIKDLSPALRHTSMFFNYGHYLELKYGTLIVPFVASNFGPRYLCKIVKNQ